jgi:CRP-like cAMP-binding protein
MFYLNSYTLMEITKPNYVHSWVSADHVSDSRNIFSSYVASMYWSCTTITTVGYGDITPKNDTDRVFVFFAMILGAGMYGYIIAALGNIISDMTAVSSIRRKKMMELSLFMDAKGLPAKLRSKVRESYRFWLERVSMYKEEEILVSLPQDLREKIAIHYAKKVFSEPDNLFSNAHPQFVAKVLPMLRPVLFQPYSTIVLQDDIAESMYIITKGILDVEVWIMMKESQQVEEELERERMDNEERTPLSLLPALSSVPSSVPPPNRTPGQKNGCVSLNSNASSLLKTKLSAPAPVLHSLPRSRIHKKSTKIATLLPGQIFGAMSILRPEQHLRRNASVKNRDHFCELFCIHRHEVVNTWLTYPTVSNYLLELTVRYSRSQNVYKCYFLC